MPEIKNYSQWSADNALDKDPIDALREYTDYARMQYLRSGVPMNTVEPELRAGVEDKLRADNLLNEETTPEQLNELQTRLFAPKTNLDFDAAVVQNYLALDDPDSGDEETKNNSTLLRDYLAKKKYSAELAAPLEGAVKDLLQDSALVRRARVAAVDRGEYNAIAVTEDDGSRSIYAGSRDLEDNEIPMVAESLVRSGALDTSDLVGLQDNYRKVFGGKSTLNQNARSAMFNDALDSLSKTDSEIADILGGASAAASKQEALSREGFVGKAAAFGKGSAAAPFVGLGEAVGAVFGQEQPKPTGAEIAEYQFRQGDGTAVEMIRQKLLENPAMRKRFSEQEITDFTNDRILKQTDYKFDNTKPESGLRQLSTGEVNIAPALLVSPQKLEDALGKAPLNEDQKEFARRQRAALLDVRVPQMLKLISSSSDEAVSAYATAKQNGVGDREFVEQWLSNEDNYGMFSNTASSLAYSGVQALGSVPLGIASLLGSEKATTIMLRSQAKQARYAEYGALFGDEFGLTREALTALPAVAVDIALTIGTAGVGRAASAAARAGSMTARTLAKGAVGVLDDAALAAVRGASAGAAAETSAALQAAGRSWISKAATTAVEQTIPVALPAFTRSASSTYVSIYGSLPEDMTHEEKHKQAIGFALAAGVGTAAITAGLSALGAGGVEKLGVRTAAKGLDDLTYREAKVLFETVKNEGKAVSDKAFRDALAAEVGGNYKRLIGGAVTGFRDEAFEEALDQSVNMAIEDAALKRNRPLAEKLQQVWNAGLIGGVLGGGLNAASQAFTPTASAQTKALQQRTAVLDGIAKRLSTSGAPETAASVQRMMDVANAAAVASTKKDAAAAAAQAAKAPTTAVRTIEEGNELGFDDPRGVPPADTRIADLVGERVFIDGTDINGIAEIDADTGEVVINFSKPTKVKGKPNVTRYVLGRKFQKATGLSLKPKVKTLTKAVGSLPVGTRVFSANKMEFVLPTIEAVDKARAAGKPLLALQRDENQRVVGVTIRGAALVARPTTTTDTTITDPDLMREVLRLYPAPATPTGGFALESGEQLELNFNAPPELQALLDDPNQLELDFEAEAPESTKTNLNALAVILAGDPVLNFLRTADPKRKGFATSVQQISDGEWSAAGDVLDAAYDFVAELGDSEPLLTKAALDTLGPILFKYDTGTTIRKRAAKQATTKSARRAQGARPTSPAPKAEAPPVAPTPTPAPLTPSQFTARAQNRAVGDIVTQAGENSLSRWAAELPTITGFEPQAHGTSIDRAIDVVLNGVSSDQTFFTGPLVGREIAFTGAGVRTYGQAQVVMVGKGNNKIESVADIDYVVVNDNVAPDIELLREQYPQVEWLTIPEADTRYRATQPVVRLTPTPTPKPAAKKAARKAAKPEPAAEGAMQEFTDAEKLEMDARFGRMSLRLDKMMGRFSANLSRDTLANEIKRVFAAKGYKESDTPMAWVVASNPADPNSLRDMEKLIALRDWAYSGGKPAPKTTATEPQAPVPTREEIEDWLNDGSNAQTLVGATLLDKQGKPFKIEKVTIDDDGEPSFELDDFESTVVPLTVAELIDDTNPESFTPYLEAGSAEPEAGVAAPTEEKPKLEKLSDFRGEATYKYGKWRISTKKMREYRYAGGTRKATNWTSWNAYSTDPADDPTKIITGTGGADFAAKELDKLDTKKAPEPEAGAPEPAAKVIAEKNKPVSPDDKRIAAPTAESNGMVVFERPNGTRYQLLDNSKTPEEYQNLNGRRVLIPGYDKSNETGGFSLAAKPQQRDSYNFNQETPTSDTVYTASDYTGRSFTISATELFNQGATITPKTTEPEAGAVEPEPAATPEAESEESRVDRAEGELDALFASEIGGVYPRMDDVAKLPKGKRAAFLKKARAVFLRNRVSPFHMRFSQTLFGGLDSSVRVTQKLMDESVPDSEIKERRAAVLDRVRGKVRGALIEAGIDERIADSRRRLENAIGKKVTSYGSLTPADLKRFGREGFGFVELAEEAAELQRLNPSRARNYFRDELLKLKTMVSEVMRFTLDTDKEVSELNKQAPTPEPSTPLVDPQAGTLSMLAPRSAAVARHAELEAKFNAGTITPEETAEAQRLVEAAARAAGLERVYHGTFAGYTPGVAGRANRLTLDDLKFPAFFTNSKGDPSYKSRGGLDRRGTSVEAFARVTEGRTVGSQDQYRHYEPQTRSELESAETFTGIPLDQRFSPQGTLSTLALPDSPALKQNIADIPAALQGMLPAGFTLVADPNMDGALGYNAVTDPTVVRYNPNLVGSLTIGLARADAMATLRTAVDHELGHAAAEAEFGEESYAALATELGEDMLSNIASIYYSLVEPDFNLRAERIKADRASGALPDWKIAAEWVRMEIERIANGRTSEQRMLFLRSRPSLLAKFIDALNAFVVRLRARFFENPTTGTAASISNAARQLRKLRNGGYLPAPPKADLNYGGHAAELIGALERGSDQTLFTMPIGAATAAGKAQVEGLWTRIGKKFQNLPPYLRDNKEERDGIMALGNNIILNFNKRFSKLTKENPAIPIDDIRTVLGRTDPTLDNAALGKIQTELDAFAGALPFDMDTVLAEEMIDKERDRLQQRERLASNNAFRQEQQSAEQRIRNAGAPALADLLVKFRTDINNMSARFTDLSPVIDENMGVYLTRTYRFHNTEGWALLAKGGIQPDGTQLGMFRGKEIDFAKLRDNAARTYEQDALAKAAKDGVVLTAEQLRDRTHEMLDKYLAKLQGSAESSPSPSQDSLQKDLTKLMPKGNINKELMELLGVIEDPLENAVRTMVAVTKIAANNTFLRSTYDTLLSMNLASTKQTPEMSVKALRVDKDGSLSPLSDLFTTPEIANALQAEWGVNARNAERNTDSVMREGGRALMAVASFATTTKTLFSFGFYPRNAVSGQGLLLSAQGILPINGYTVEAYGLARRAYFESNERTPEQDAMIQRLIELQVLADDTQGRVAMDIMRGFVTDNEQDLDALLRDFQEATEGKPKKLLDRIGESLPAKKYGRTVDILASLNNWFDGAVKTQAYMYELDVLKKDNAAALAKDPELLAGLELRAADKVKATMPSHSRQLPIVKSLNQTSVGMVFFPFARWKTEVFRTMYNTPRLALKEIREGGPAEKARGYRRMFGFTSTLAFGGSAVGAVYAGLFRLIGGVFGEDEEKKDARELTNDELYALRESLPVWQRGHALHTRLVGGQVQVIDMTAITPYAQLTDLFVITHEGIVNKESDWNAKRTAGYVAQQLIGTQIAATALNEALNNSDDFGQPIYRETDNPVEVTGKILAHFGGSAMKPAAFDQLGRAFRSGEQDRWEIITGELLGARPRNHKMSEIEYRAFRGVKKMLDDSAQIKASLVTGRKLDEDEVVQTLEDHQESLNRTQRKLAKVMQGLHSMGSTRGGLFGSGKNAGFSAQRLALAEKGDNLRWVPNQDWLKGVYQNMKRTGEDDPMNRINLIRRTLSGMPATYGVFE